MLTRRLAVSVPKFLTRNIGITAALQQTSVDPIQALFLKKVKEYGELAKSGKPIDMPQQLVKEKKDDLERVARQFGIAPGTDLSQFPTFKFAEPKVVTQLVPQQLLDERDKIAEETAKQLQGKDITDVPKFV